MTASFASGKQASAQSRSTVSSTLQQNFTGEMKGKHQGKLARQAVTDLKQSDLYLPLRRNNKSSLNLYGTSHP